MLLSVYENRTVTPERLVAGGYVRCANLDQTLWFVRSPTNMLHDHIVRVRGEEFQCDCHDYVHTMGCVHIVAVRAVLLRQSWHAGGAR